MAINDVVITPPADSNRTTIGNGLFCMQSAIRLRSGWKWPGICVDCFERCCVILSLPVLRTMRTIQCIYDTIRYADIARKC